MSDTTTALEAVEVTALQREELTKKAITADFFFLFLARERIEVRVK